MFLVALAALGMAACSNNDDVTGYNGETSSVIIKLNGVSTTRALGDPTEGVDGDGPTIQLNDGKILFTNGTAILMVKDLVIDEATGQKGQLIHDVPAAVSQVQIIGNVSGETELLAAIDGKSLAEVKSVAFKSGSEQDMDALPLFGEDTTLAEASEGTDTQEGHTSVFQADIELGTLFSRIEIGNFKCTDLGKLYSKVDIKIVGLLNFQNAVNLAGGASDPVMIYDEKTNQGLVLEPGKTAEGKIVFGAADPNYGWAWEASDISMTRNDIAYNPNTNQRYVYNFVPQGDVLAALYVDATPKESAALRINNTLKGKLGTLAPGHIYRVDYTFTEGDIKPWNPDATKCVNVKVTVKKWQIKTLSPTFD